MESILNEFIILHVKCPFCETSLMDRARLVDGQPGIKLSVETPRSKGTILLSAVYESFNYKCDVEIVEGDIVKFFCPHCLQRITDSMMCEECEAPLIPFLLDFGGKVLICSRAGCKAHFLEFEDFREALYKILHLGEYKDAIPENIEKEREAREIIDLLKDMEHKGYQYEGAESSFELLVRRHLGKYKPFFELEKTTIIEDQFSRKGGASSSAMIIVIVDGERRISAAEGDGPVNALDRALRGALENFYPELKHVHLTDYKVRVLNPEDATAAKVRVWIESTDGADSWTTVGVSTDILEASCRALVDSIEYKLLKTIERKFKPFM